MGENLSGQAKTSAAPMSDVCDGPRLVVNSLDRLDQTNPRRAHSYRKGRKSHLLEGGALFSACASNLTGGAHETIRQTDM